MWRNYLLALCMLCGGTSILFAQMEGNLVYLQPVSCNGEADGEAIIEGVGGQAPYLYSIDGCNTFVAPGIFTGLEAGIYTVCILDMNGDTGYFQLNMPEPLPLIPTIAEQTEVSCFGGNDGRLSLVGTGGTAPYEFSLGGSTFAPSGTFTNLSGGVYPIVIRDANGCQTVSQVGVDQAAPIQLIVEEQVGTSCEGGNTGSLRLNAAGGQGGYSFQLDGGGVQPNGTFENLAAGTFNLLIQDDSLCTEIFEVEVPAWEGWRLTVDAPPLRCAEIADGAIDVAVEGANPPFLYRLEENGEFQAISRFEGLAEGMYDVTVQDVNGCDTTFLVELSAPDPLSISLDIMPPSCAGEEDAQVEILALGGTTPYEVSWSNGPFSPELGRENLGAGTHSFLLRDAQGCRITETFSIEAPGELLAEVLNVGATPCGEREGRALLDVSGGQVPYEFSIDGQTQQSDMLTNLSAGVQTLRVIDALGCEVQLEIDIPEVGGINAGFYTTPDINSPIPLERAEVRLVNISEGADTYEWDFGDGNGSTEAEPFHTYTQPGTYEILLVASRGLNCRDSLSRSVTIVNGDDLFFVPNAFSPNGDGKNDFFTIRGRSLIRAEMTVFDRTGRRVAFSEVFPNTWAGTDLYGKSAAPGRLYLFATGNPFGRRGSHTGRRIHLGSIVG